MTSTAAIRVNYRYNQAKGNNEMDAIRVGIIGMGNMGCQYAEMIIKGEVPGMELVAVTRIREERKAWQKEVLSPDIPIFLSDEELLAYDGMDAVIIATPHYAHPRQVKMAFARGLHVLCEKPGGVFVRQVREMNEEADKSNRIFGMIFNQRMNPLYQEVRNIVRDGRYGALKRVNWIITDWYRPQVYYGRWRGTWETDGGGLLLNQCPHNLDLMQWICGMPKRVQAHCHEGKWHDIQVEDDVSAYLEFEHGATGIFVASTGDAPGTNRLEITLDDAKILVEDKQIKLYELAVSEREFCLSAQGDNDKPAGRWITIDHLGPNLAHLGILRDFADAILQHKPLLADGREGIDSLRIANAMYLSSWTKTMVELPVDEELFEQEFKRNAEKYKALM